MFKEPSGEKWNTSSWRERWNRKRVINSSEEVRDPERRWTKLSGELFRDEQLLSAVENVDWTSGAVERFPRLKSVSEAVVFHVSWKECRQSVYDERLGPLKSLNVKIRMAFYLKRENKGTGVGSVLAGTQIPGRTGTTTSMFDWIQLFFWSDFSVFAPSFHLGRINIFLTDDRRRWRSSTWKSECGQGPVPFPSSGLTCVSVCVCVCVCVIQKAYGGGTTRSLLLATPRSDTRLAKTQKWQWRHERR